MEHTSEPRPLSHHPASYVPRPQLQNLVSTLAALCQLQAGSKWDRISLIVWGEGKEETTCAFALGSLLMKEGSISIQTCHGHRDPGPSVPLVGERVGYSLGPPQVATAPSVGIKSQTSQESPRQVSSWKAGISARCSPPPSVVNP